MTHHNGSDAGAQGDIWGVTAYFNPAAYSNKQAHLRIFSERVRKQGLKLLIIELAFGDAAHVVDERFADRVMRVRSNSVLWQKERLLNIAVKNLPRECDKVVWLDADLLFQNDQWVKEISVALLRNVVVQPFDKAWWLSPASTAAVSSGLGSFSEETLSRWQLASERSVASAACARSQNGPDSMCDISDSQFGHHGFAWAARRSLLDSCGLYDRCILGGGDSIATCGMYGYFESTTGPKLVAELAKSGQAIESSQHVGRFYMEIQGKRLLAERSTRSQAVDITQWAHRFYGEINNRVGYIPGSLYHLWHGSRENRQYLNRWSILKEADFNPVADISMDGNDCWQWNSEKPELHRKVKEYFWTRAEELQLPENCATGEALVP